MYNNILFIGGAGFIGSNLIRKLIRYSYCKDCQIHVLEPPYANINRLNSLSINIHRVALRDFDDIESIISSNNIKIVVHLVSSMIPRSTYEDYMLEFQNVIFPTVRLMQLCSIKGIKFIYFSSGGTIYGDRKVPIPFMESDSLEPISYYGLSKQMIENSIQFEHRISGLQFLILRPSNPYGCGQNLFGNQGFIAVSIGHILQNNPISIWGDGSSIRDYIYIDDLSELFYILLQKNITNQIINIGSGKGHSINDIISLLKDIVEEDVKVEHIGAEKSDVSNMILDITQLKLILPNFKFTDIKDGIKEFYKSEKSLQTYE